MMATSDEEFERNVERARERFSCPIYVLKDQYRDPDAPYFVAAYYISAKGTGGLPILQAHAKVGPKGDEA
jgi:hypothetical protein